MYFSLVLAILITVGINLSMLTVVYAGSPVSVNFNSYKQVIDGFGCAGTAHMARHLMNFPEPQRSQVLDMLFSTTNGAGLSIIRNMINDGNGISDEWGDSNDGPSPSIEPSEGVWNWDDDDDQIWFMNQAKARGCTTFFSTVWSPPAWMKTNNSTIWGGNLRTDKYQAFADYLSRYVREYKSRFGLDIYAVSIQNEPDFSTPYSSCRWDQYQFRDFIKNYLKPTFSRDSVTAKVMMPEPGEASDSLINEYCSATFNDSDAASRVDIVAAHGYRTNAHPVAIAKNNNKKFWQTEIAVLGENNNDSSISNGVMWARNVHDWLVNDANAWCYFWGPSSYYMNQTSLVGLNTSNNTVVKNKRLFTIGNYSRFVRPGYYRVDSTTNPTSDVYVSAYKDQATNKAVIVAINSSGSTKDLTFNLSGTYSGNMFTQYRTSDNEELSQLTDVQISNNSFSVTLKANSVTTFVSGTGSTNPGTNLVVNPGLETGSFSPWTSWNTAGISSSNARTGSYCIYTGNNNCSAEQVITGLSPNTTYTLRAYARVAVSGEGVKLGVKDYGGTEVNTTISSTSYAQGSIQFTTGSGNTSAKIYLWKDTGTGAAYGDDFELVVGGTTSNPNLVVNSGLETGSFSPWTSWNTAGISSSNARTGSYCIYTGNNNCSAEQVITGLSPNTTYTLRAYARVAVSGEGVKLGVKDFGGTETNTTISSTSYQQGSIQFTTGSGNTSAKIYLWKDTGTGAAYGDDFELVKN